MTSARSITNQLSFDPRAFTAQSFNSGDPREKAYAEGWTQFCAWYERARGHHEFCEAARQLAAATHDDDAKIRTARQWAVLWNCWRAASWEPDPFFDERVFADDLMKECVRLIGNPTTSPVPGALSAMALYIERSGVAGRRFSEHVTATELRELRERLARALEALMSVAFLERWQHGPLLYSGRDGKEGRTRLQSAPTMLAAQLDSFFQGQDVDRKWQLIMLLVAISGLGDDVSEESLRVSAGKVDDLVDKGRVKIVGWPADVGATFDEMQRLFATVQ